MSGSLAEDTQAPGRLRSGQRGSWQALAVCTFISLLANGAGAETENIAQSLSDPSAFAVIQDPAVRSRAIFSEMARVIESPGCMNCHPATDRPTQGNDRHQHIPFAGRGEGGVGVAGGACRECHGEAISQFRRALPIRAYPDIRVGVSPPSMAWQGKTPGEICRQIKDPGRNGGRSLELLHDHAAKDDLVAWGWHPGAGREPAPGTQELFGRLIQAWIDSGAECP